MKCDELEKFDATSNADRSAGIESRYAYDAEEVDEAIAELKGENESLKGDIADLRDDRKSSVAIIDELNAENAQLKAKLESVQASAYAESVDVGMENRKLKHALWLDRAKRAHVTILLWNIYCYQNNCLYFSDFMNVECNPFRRLPKKTAMEWSDLWESIETKCLKKAGEYK